METLTKETILAYLRTLKPELKKNGIEKIGLFGSYAKGCADIASDIDIVIRTTPRFAEMQHDIEAFLYLERLRRQLMQAFHKKVDISDEAGLKQPMKETIYA